MSKESYFIGCAEVAELVGCGKSRAYKYIQQMNRELEARGNLTFPGRVPRRYAMERFGLLGEVQEDESTNARAAGSGAAAQLLVVGNIAAAVAFQQKPPVETLVTVPVVAEIEQVECVRQDPVPYEPVTYQVPLDAELQSYTEKMCDLYDVPLELAYAVMQVESDFTPAAHSSTGDYGLMQINSINAGWLKDELGITDLLDARQNIQAGCYMLGMYLSEYEGNVNCALMAYNLGATGAKKAWSAGTYSTAYTDKVWNAMVGLLEGERDVS